MAPSAEDGKRTLARFLLEFALDVEAEVQQAAEAPPLKSTAKNRACFSALFLL